MPKAKTSTLTLDTFRAANTPGRGSGCSLRTFLRLLSPMDREAVTSALHDPAIQTRAVHRVIARIGFAHGENVIARHRRGLCGVCQELAR